LLEQENEIKIKRKSKYVGDWGGKEREEREMMSLNYEGVPKKLRKEN